MAGRRMLTRCSSSWFSAACKRGCMRASAGAARLRFLKGRSSVGLCRAFWRCVIRTFVWNMQRGDVDSQRIQMRWKMRSDCIGGERTMGWEAMYREGS